MLRLTPLLLSLVLVSIGTGCPNEPHASAGTPAAKTSAKPGAPTPPAPKAEAPDKGPQFVAAGEGAVDEVVRHASAKAKTDERQLVVYVGASWCEPCMDFHHAVERGELDEALAGVRFVEFDSDRDGARLRDAGYGGRLIPRFVVPGPDGRSSERRIEGGIKGEGSVAHIMGRLGPLLGTTPG
ncbi:MAG: thioredoxin [Myxococcota bacterium]